jgi:hypothetical protein
MDPLPARLWLDPRDVGQKLRARITKDIKSISPDLGHHAAQPTAARAHIINLLSLVPRTLSRTSGASRVVVSGIELSGVH